MMTKPAKPEDHPAPEEASTVKGAHAPNGVPPGADQAEATAYPTSERQATETAALPDKH